MIIYKITNKVNGKVYVGQTSYSAEQRFVGHCINAFELNCDYFLSKALRKYGKENFSVEVLKEVDTKKEANFFEKYFIKQFNSNIREFGYNMTDGGEGGNTYLMKTSEEMDIIKSKISIANSGGNNGNAHHLYMKNILTDEVTYFGSSTLCDEFLKTQGIKIPRVALTRLKEVERFGFQTAVLGKYIFSNTEQFSPYSLVEPKQGSYRWRVEKDGEVVYYANTTEDLIQHFNWTMATYIKRSKKEGYDLIKLWSRKNEQL